MKRRFFSKLEIFFIFALACVFLFILSRYIDNSVIQSISAARVRMHFTLMKRKPCAQGLIRIETPDHDFLCREPLDPSPWLAQYDTLPLSVHGQEIAYEFLDEGDITTADALLNHQFVIDRFPSVTLPPPLTWTEDPYHERYWRFVFYSLRPARHLLAAWRATGDERYRTTLINLISGFVSSGMDKPYTWDDNHAVAFRTMILVNTWWKLREAKALPTELGIALLPALEKHGEFLMDPRHYEAAHNHGVTEAIALFQLGATFPTFAHAQEWRDTGLERLNRGLQEIVDDDGILIENSPYYHFYVLQHYWQMYAYLKKTNLLPTHSLLEEKIQRMISYGTYILQPNLHIPLLGASIERSVANNGIFRDLSDYNPYFRFVLTQGVTGTPPPYTSIHYPTAGQTIFRSGWGDKETFSEQTQIIFDVGPYRTQHSDLDALSFSLSSGGAVLLPDSGLYTYEDTPERAYFHGTLAHNTIVVDGKDQREGASLSGIFTSKNGMTYQSAAHSLYTGVEHRRSIALLEKRRVLIIDTLDSDETHTYQQLFHFSPGAQITRTNTGEMQARFSLPEQTVTMHQALTPAPAVVTEGQQDPYQGWCATSYEKAVPCPLVSYARTGSSVEYITLLELGIPDPALHITLSNNHTNIVITTTDTVYTVTTATRLGKKGSLTVHTQHAPQPHRTPVESFTYIPSWTITSQTTVHDELVTADSTGMTLHSPSDGNRLSITKPLRLNLSQANLFLQSTLTGREATQEIELSLSTNHWKGYVTNDLRNTHRPEYDSETMSVTLGKGLLRNRGGQWREYGEGFDWADIDEIKFRITSFPGTSATWKLHELAIIPNQQSGSVMIVFDDGHNSVLKGLPSMEQYGMKGTLSIIADRILLSARNYLTLEEVKQFQNTYGWAIANHSRSHKNGLNAYFKPHDLEGYETDITDGLKFLAKNNINTAANWYIFPNGATNRTLKNIIGKYYMFARATQNQPEVFPFGDPLGVKTFSVEDTTPPEDVIRAVHDAKRYNLSLFLTFHRIKDTRENMHEAGYALADFETVIKGIADSGIAVKTLSQFDTDNGIGQPTFDIQETVLDQMSLSLSRTVLPKKNEGLLQKIRTIF